MNFSADKIEKHDKSINIIRRISKRRRLG